MGEFLAPLLVKMRRIKMPLFRGMETALSTMDMRWDGLSEGLGRLAKGSFLLALKMTDWV